jgi:hypothetical protein
MADYNPEPLPVGEDLFLEARALALSLVAIRRAQGKPNPADFAIGTPQWKAVVEDFAADILRLPSDRLARLAPVARSVITK